MSFTCTHMASHTSNGQPTTTSFQPGDFIYSTSSTDFKWRCCLSMVCTPIHLAGNTMGSLWTACDMAVVCTSIQVAGNTVGSGRTTKDMGMVCSPIQMAGDTMGSGRTAIEMAVVCTFIQMA